MKRNNFKTFIMLVTLQSGLVQFLHATPITVEVSITRGIKYFIVGLADTALKESKQRIYTAIKNTQFHWPGQRITINLAPPTTRKFGTLAYIIAYNAAKTTSQ